MVSNDHHEVITKKGREKLQYYKSSSSYNKGGKGKVAVCNDHHEVITKKEVEKLRYVMIIMKL